jgi:hypothetical protein
MFFLSDESSLAIHDQRAFTTSNDGIPSPAAEQKQYQENDQ